MEITTSRNQREESARFRLLSRYISPHANQVAMLAHATMRGEPEPYSQWRWEPLPAPRYHQSGIRWALRRIMLRRFIRNGGVLVVVGQPGSGKSVLLERLMPHRVIENYLAERLKGNFDRNARISLSEVPTDLFAIDETQVHNREDVLKILDLTAQEKRGLALVFQYPDSFRQYEIAAYIANRRVLFLEFT